MCEKFFIEISLMLFSTSGSAIALKKATQKNCTNMHRDKFAFEQWFSLRFVQGRAD